jgi:hypothetical protein
MPTSRRDEVAARAQGRCEGCGVPLDGSWECHHRQGRGMGGSARPEAHALSNLLALCRPCHADATSEQPWVVSAGLVVRRWQSPFAVPVRYRQGRWVFLDDDGSLVAAPADELMRAAVAAERERRTACAPRP